MGCVSSKVSNSVQESPYQYEEKQTNKENDDTNLPFGVDMKSNTDNSDIIVEVSTSSDSFGQNEVNSSTLMGYHSILKLGQGSYGTVLEMEKNKVHYAVKICNLKNNKFNFLQKNTYDPKEEALIMKKFNHPNVIKIYDLIEDVANNQICIVMELLKGGNIAQCTDLESKKLAFSQALSALQYIHFQRVAHRDIKIENVLRHTDGSIRIVDFGISIFVPEGKDMIPTEDCGTPHYMAPEIFTEPEYDPFKADIYSLGVLLYVLMIGHEPYQNAMNRFQIPEMQKQGMTFPNDIDVNLKDLILKMTAYCPDDRISLAQVWKEKWMENVPGTPTVQGEQIYSKITRKETLASIIRLYHANTVAILQSFASL